MGSCSKTPRPGFWLDVLPPDIRIRIATFACAGEYDITALELAETSLNMRQAVVAAFQYKLNIQIIAARTPHRWVDLFKPFLREVTCDKFWIANLRFRIQKLLPDIFTSEALKRVEIIDEVPYWEAIQSLTSIEQLRVYEVNESIPFREKYKNIRAESLATLNIQKLKMVCYDGLAGSNCPFGGSGKWNETIGALPECCLQLKSLTLLCHWKHDRWDDSNEGMDEANRGSYLWEALPKFRALQCVRFDLEPPNTAMEALRQIDRVGYGAATLLDIPKNIGRGLISLHLKDALKESELSFLSYFPNLEFLEVSIEKGGEQALIYNVNRMAVLQTFKLRFAVDDDDQLGNAEAANAPVVVNGNDGDANQEGLGLVTEGNEAVPGVENQDSMRYYAIKPGTVLQIIETCPRISHLELVCVQMSMEELESVLKVCGRKLLHLSVPIMCQQELGMHRLESILLALLKYNPLLRSFRTERRKAYFCTLLHGSWDSLRRRLNQLMDRLERRNPFIDLHELRDSVIRLPLKT